MEIEPFPHEVGVAFTDERYAELIHHLPPDKEYEVYKSYPDRMLLRSDRGFWGEVFAELTRPFANAVCQLARDRPGYSLGPHTDGENKKSTTLFYLGRADAGTSLFRPLKPIHDDQHHPFSDFELVKTIPFEPNTYLSFNRTSRSFHGVLPCTVTRNLMILSVYA